MAELCIAHPGHLHHPLAPDHLKAPGRIDVVPAPVGGGATITSTTSSSCSNRSGAPLVIPMHFGVRFPRG